ncbi:glutathione peroxidase [Yamadazyma tenuis]|uniref:Glutathione peroxidase n=1 Tax=Candida tenuis (strain ATCC 10573 / BCRC 21748 / CBS 615 / JCM 9827 / NBRC 10315 / NRRL Y-1498 / VKM Y-70) TaxID=590646 RepID=G3B648_CANTC|nr:glutathione peroxidase [Yamadazyma tenuis ATCC 10573]EGV63379.1 glutathione peroxidase [Yamadazyma tenuis ATCC 10573]WEJ96796.1 glutathione peroxidase [Yamadazyma tenuis]
MAQSIYDISVLDSTLQQVSLSQYKGKVIVIVNTATLCGFAPQFEELQTLYHKYKDDGLVILAFPSNQFWNEEPAPIDEIVRETKQKFGVEFPIMNKVLVNGSNADDIYKFLKAARPGKLGFQGVFWNFEKFVIDRNGNVVYRFPSDISPLTFEKYLTPLLG